MSLPAKMTFSQIREDVFTSCTLNTGGDRGARAVKLVDKMIRRAVRELSIKAPWLRLAVTETIELDDEVSEYDFPDAMDPGRYMEVEIRHAESGKLLPLRPDPSRTQRNAYINTVGRPLFYWFEDEKLHIVPAPDADTYDRIEIRGYKRDTDLLKPDDVVAIDGEAVAQRAEIYVRPRVGLRVSQDMIDSHLAYIRDLRGTQTEGGGTIMGGDTSAKCAPQSGSEIHPSVYQYDEGWQPPGF